MKIDTLITHAGRKPEDWHGFVNPPVYHGSTVLFPTIREYYESQKEAYNGYRYAREGNPTSRCLEEALGEIEGGRTLALSSGITAVAASLLSQLSAGDHLLMTDSAYGPSRRLAAIELKRFGIDTTFYDPLIGAGIKELFQPNTRVVYTESPGSLTFEVQDIPAISNAAHDAGIIVIMDNSWATPLFYKAFNKGVDIVVHSATKYINGHSDVVGGIITCNEDSYTSVSRFAKTIGIAASPENCFLMQRGLRSLGVRMQVHQKSALYLAGKLREHPLVEKVLHPAFPDCPGHDIWKRDYCGSSGLFSIVLKKLYNETELAKMLDGMRFLKMGYSWGGFESLIIPFCPRAIRSTPWPHNGSMLRLSIGLEDADDLREDITQGLARLP